MSEIIDKNIVKCLFFMSNRQKISVKILKIVNEEV